MNGVYPPCPFCRRGILHLSFRPFDESVIDSLLEQGVLVRPQENYVTFLHTCLDTNCDQYLKINGHCHCTFLLRYIFFATDPYPVVFAIM